MYSPARHDDGLVLSIKGSLSESELTLLRARMRGGAMNKARRGELYHNLPAGFLLEGDRLAKDPDRQVRHAIGEVFHALPGPGIGAARDGEPAGRRGAAARSHARPRDRMG